MIEPLPIDPGLKRSAIVAKINEVIEAVNAKDAKPETQTKTGHVKK